ncbi:PIN domain-containing protein [Lacipirellula limnantheis]|uniref:Ribonuclease VapC n=1 Tax=Lacipirellula limnantheis TaxID=2528024 RepID=A0A517U632_9BACT|nr:PIN domain-containing protein [Lacipirellula limnantheis]QDT76063.1 tRNA(fMet)-specific endonuclease VapC [Lacipirellula limnantheis]
MILDTNAVSALLAGQNGSLHRILDGADQHHLPLPVIAEYQYGLLRLPRPQRLQSLFRRLEADSIVLLPDRTTADVYATVRQELKTKGQPISENDVWIAALSRQFDLEVVSQDAHFDHVPRIRRISW